MGIKTTKGSKSRVSKFKQFRDNYDDIFKKKIKIKDLTFEDLEHTMYIAEDVYKYEYSKDVVFLLVEYDGDFKWEFRFGDGILSDGVYYNSFEEAFNEAKKDMINDKEEIKEDLDAEGLISVYDLIY